MTVFLIFFKTGGLVEGCSFLPCVQCPKTLNLSYQKQHSEIFSLSVKKLLDVEKRSNNFKATKILKNWTKSSRKMG